MFAETRETLGIGSFLSSQLLVFLPDLMQRDILPRVWLPLVVKLILLKLTRFPKCAETKNASLASARGMFWSCAVSAALAIVRDKLQLT